MDEITTVNDIIPKELVNDVYHPGNDPYMQVQKAVEAEIVDISMGMEPLHIEIAKMRVKGMSNKDIGKSLRKSQNTIAKIRKLPSVIRLESYLNELRRFNDGPSAEIRKAMLWRIAKDNEQKDPKEATKALAELNKMNAPKGGHTGIGTINIVVQNAALQKGSLDG